MKPAIESTGDVIDMPGAKHAKAPDCTAQTQLTPFPGQSRYECRVGTSEEADVENDDIVHIDIQIERPEARRIPSLGELPEEILVHILAEVPFSPESFLDMTLVCRKFHRILRIDSKDESNLMSRQVTQRQYSLLNVFRAFDPTWNNVNRLEWLNGQVNDIVSIVKANMTLEDTLAEADGWEEFFFNCLLLFLSSGHQKLAGDENWSDLLTGDLYTDTVLGKRYVCIKLSQCLLTMANKFKSCTSVLDSLGYKKWQSNDCNIDNMAIGLETIFLLGGLESHELLWNLLKVVSNCPEEIVYLLYPVACRSSFWANLATRHLSSLLKYDSDLSRGDMNNVNSFFLVNDKCEAIYGGRCPGGHTLLLVKRILDHEKINLLEFMQRYGAIGWQDDDEALEAWRTLVTHQKEVRSSDYPYTDPRSFNWESVVRTKLLDGRSELRRSFNPTASFFKEVIRHESSGKNDTDD